MTHQQILSFAVIILMMGAFIWGKFRYDVVAKPRKCVIEWDNANSYR